MKKKSRKPLSKAQKQRNRVKVAAPIEEEPTAIKNAPHTFVIRRGERCSSVSKLSRDFRRMMEPFTAAHLRESRINKVKDFVHMSGYFHVSHMCLLSLSTESLSLKVIRMPKGPTLTFRVHQYTLAKDVINSARKQFVDEDCFKAAPLVILNNFSGEGKHLKLMASTFQNMFPSINLSTVNLSSLKRCVLLSYNPVSKLVDLRHYTITVVPVNLNKGVKKIVTRNIPDLGRFEDIADFVEKGHLLSESEVDDEESHVVLPQNLNRGNLEDNKSSLRLHEIGPRITMRLMKIEDDLMTGEVLYHDCIEKSAIEVEAMRKKRAQQRKLKEMRKQKQAENIKKKENKKEDHRAKTSAQEKSNQINETDKLLLKDAEEAVGELSDEDDREYYRDAIGANPEDELFDSAHKGARKRPFIPKGSSYSLKPKKPRMDNRKQYDEDDDRHDSKKRNGGGKNGKGKFGRKGMRDELKGKSKYNGGKHMGRSKSGGSKKTGGGKKSSRRK
ncbi:protein Peter pan isoform X1 [Anopheles ziemanni]|uniref:protein Peter pan isoform X1 n=1 Tax=Anopheles coustani TaxID=139045 RepID=UPI00265B0859|nr:protein Peter pan isoform X1 [Anopheles coustani]XP_058173965.1 protein Peter pan isoform X1 [Anopheles ziemanni]